MRAWDRTKKHAAWKAEGKEAGVEARLPGQVEHGWVRMPMRGFMLLYVASVGRAHESTFISSASSDALGTARPAHAAPATRARTNRKVAARMVAAVMAAALGVVG